VAVVAMIGAIRAGGLAMRAAKRQYDDPSTDPLARLMAGSICRLRVTFSGQVKPLFRAAACAGIHLVARGFRDRALHGNASGAGEGFTP